jgi:hypothetical protein
MRTTLALLAASVLLVSDGFGQNPVKATTEDGRQVLLYPDNTWKLALGAAQAATPSGGLTRPATATKTVDIHAGSTRLSYDPTRWTPEPSTDRSRMTFQHTDGDGYALVIRERLQMSLDALKDIALNNAIQAAPDAKIVFEESRVVNGAPVLCLIIEGTTSGIAFTYYGYYYSGKSGIVQIVTYTGQNLFEEYKPDFENFLNGFEVVN